MRCEPWVEAADLTGCDGYAEADAAGAIDLIIGFVSDTLFWLSGSQFQGTCQATLRPCVSFGSPILSPVWGGDFPWIPARVDGQWINTIPDRSCSCDIGGPCGCDGLKQLDLHKTDVQSVDVVTIAGVIVDASAYRLDEHRFLVRTDGGVWPCCQDLSKPATEEGTWSVDVTFGKLIPDSGKYAAKILACELIAAEYDPDNCRLPFNVASAVRQGISYDFLTPELFLENGRTGLRQVDMFLSAANPKNLRRRGRVWSPDLKKHRQVRSSGSS